MMLKFGDPESIATAKHAAKRAKSRKIGPDERAEMQIGKMHKTYGVHPGRECCDCVYFTRVQPGNNVYKKCRVFGISRGPATDWRSLYTACGKFQKRD